MDTNYMTLRGRISGFRDVPSSGKAHATLASSALGTGGPITMVFLKGTQAYSDAKGKSDGAFACLGREFGDGFNGAHFVHNTIYGFVDARLHGHHHSSGWGEPSHNHGSQTPDSEASVHRYRYHDQQKQHHGRRRGKAVAREHCRRDDEQRKRGRQQCKHDVGKQPSERENDPVHRRGQVQLVETEAPVAGMPDVERQRVDGK